MKKYKIFKHSLPLWHDKVDSFIMADVTDDEDEDQWEKIWTRRVEKERYEICCIPFFTYKIALGDIVRADWMGAFRWVVEPSGRSVFRVYFEPEFDPSTREARIRDVLNGIADLGGEMEFYNEDLLAIDAKNKDIADKVIEFLKEWEDNTELLEYEHGKYP